MLSRKIFTCQVLHASGKATAIRTGRNRRPDLPRQVACASLALALAVLAGAGPEGAQAQGRFDPMEPIIGRNLWVPREQAKKSPEAESEQSIINGWRLYRTQRGQEAFNHAMATMRATEADAPPAIAFKGCSDLRCPLELPRISAEGWLPAGRLWVSPQSYVIIAHSPRFENGDRIPRRPKHSMRYFIFHEFHNSTGNTDPYDTISAHRGSVFVPFYMGKQQTDAKGRQFVVVVQIAPHNVASRHATTHGHAGPGIEVAKNYRDRLATLQAYAGILVALMVKQGEPQLKVDRHRGQEGLAMLRAYYQRRSALRDTPNKPRVSLPFVPAASRHVARATGTLGDMIAGHGASSVALAALAPRPAPISAPAPRLAVRPEPVIRPPAPELVTFRPPEPEGRPPEPEGETMQAATSLTMETLLQRILGERRDVDRARNCAVVWHPDCRG